LFYRPLLLEGRANIFSHQTSWHTEISLSAAVNGEHFPFITSRAGQSIDVRENLFDHLFKLTKLSLSLLPF
jgi:hypothetical protein